VSRRDLPNREAAALQRVRNVTQCPYCVAQKALEPKKPRERTVSPCLEARDGIVSEWHDWEPIYIPLDNRIHVTPSPVMKYEACKRCGMVRVMKP